MGLDTAGTWPAALATASALELNGVRFRYPGGSDWTVDVASLIIQPGEQVLLAGGSGVGKSTLLQLIAGLMDPAEGTIRVAGRDMHALHGASRDQHRGRTIGMIFQTFNLLHGFSALENVLAALMFSAVPRAEHQERAASLLTHLGIAPDRHGARPDQLSVGQQQRVAVARAVAARPAIVLADEPTASLDPDNAAAAMRLIQSTCQEQGAALLCVSHDPSMAAKFSRRERLADLRGRQTHAAASIA